MPLAQFSWFQGSIVAFSGDLASSDSAGKRFSNTWLFVPPVVSLACTTLFYVLYSAHPLKVRVGGTIYLVYFAAVCCISLLEVVSKKKHDTPQQVSNKEK